MEFSEGFETAVLPQSYLILDFRKQFNNPRNKLRLLSTRITHVEPHIKESNYIRDLVFGFCDGVNTSLGIVAGVGGAIIAADVVILFIIRY